VRIVPRERLGTILAAVPGVPRVVAGGNYATPWSALAVLDAAVAEYRLFMLNAQPGVPDRDGVVLESPFVGPGVRGRPGLRYFPCRLSLVPVLLGGALPPDVVLVQTSAPADGTISLGTEVNVLPAAIEAVRSRGGLVIAQLNRQVPYTYGDAVLTLDQIDYAIETEARPRYGATTPPRRPSRSSPGSRTRRSGTSCETPGASSDSSSRRPQERKVRGSLTCGRRVSRGGRAIPAWSRAGRRPGRPRRAGVRRRACRRGWPGSAARCACRRPESRSRYR